MLFAAALSGQSASRISPVCYEEGRETECEQVERDRVARTYRIGRIEDAAGSGATVYRALILNDWERDVVLVSAMSGQGQPPRLVVQGPDGQRMMTNISPMTWRRIVDQAKGVDDVRPEPPARRLDAEGDITRIDGICMHAWSMRLEMANAVDVSGRSRPVRRVRQSSCDHDRRAFQFGWMLADLAVETLPVCRSLEEDRYRNGPTRLQACVGLQGDRRTAADLMNRKSDPPDRSGFGWAVSDWSRWLNTDERARLDWDGAVYQEGRGAASVAEALVEQVDALSGVDLYPEQFGARNGREGWVDGTIHRQLSGEGEPDRRAVADYRQIWRLRDGEWSLESWTVGPFREISSSE
jgi:hypothetical protein